MTRRPLRFVVALAVAVWVAPPGLRGQDQDPQPPTFRAGVDLIELDVSVLDRNRRPVEGLTAVDFTVFEDGRPQRIVTASHVDVAEHDPARSARMRYVPRDVAANDLADQLGPGKLVAIVFDDMNLPGEDPDTVRAARETARYVVDQLGPSDMAAVVYSHSAGRTQDFTDDRRKLLEAIDRFQPNPPDWIPDTPQGGGTRTGGDMLQQWSPTLARSPCMRAEPAVPTLDTVASRLATVPGRRKALIFISVGVNITLSAGDSCASMLAEVVKDVFRTSQRANINIFPISPVGYVDYQRLLDLRNASRGRTMALDRRRPPSVPVLRDFMRTMAENTGGRAIIDTAAVEPAIDRIFEEDQAYYLLGYESDNPRLDGRFRRVEVRVNRPDVSVRSRSGYWAASAKDPLGRRPDSGPASPNAALAGLRTAAGVRLRAHALPLVKAAAARSASPGGIEVATVLTVRYPPIRAAVADTLRIVRNIYDADGNAGPPVQEIVTAELTPGGGDEVPFELTRRLTLAPGRYQVRFNVQSTRLGASGSVFADVDVPDFARALLSMSGVVLGRPAQDAATAAVPVIPTTARDFAQGDTLAAFVRIYQGGAEPPVPVTVATEVLDANDVSRHAATITLAPEIFEQDRGAPFRFDVPLAELGTGPHLVSITAQLPGGRTARRDVVIRVR